MGRKHYHVYILANRSASTLYVGVTGDIDRRIAQHKGKDVPGFASRYNLDQLVYCEATHDVRAAISREKQIKGWRRSRKIDLIESENPDWRDLSAGWSGTLPHRILHYVQDDNDDGRSPRRL